MTRPTTLFGLSWRLIRHCPRIRLVTLAVLGALGLSFGAGFVMAPRGPAPHAVLSPPASAPPAALLGHPGDADRGVIVVDHEGLVRGQHIDVLARGLRLAPATEAPYLAAPLLIRIDERTRWVPGDVVAVRESGALGYFGELGRRLDLDADGRPDDFWHATRHRVDETHREQLQGYLVYEGRAGHRLVELGHSDGWGTEERLETRRLIDVAGGPAPDLVMIIDTSVSEVGPSGHVVRVLHFDRGEPTVALDHAVSDPVAGTGLAQYRMGHFDFDLEGGTMSARTLVLAAPGSLDEPAALHVRRESWTRTPTGDLVHHVDDGPLRTASGETVLSFGGAPLGVDPEGARRYLVDDGGQSRWVRRVRFADERFGSVFYDYPEEAPTTRDWVRGLWP